MPGFDRRLEQQIAQVKLAAEVLGITMVPQKLLDDQNKLILELKSQAFKKPSLFKVIPGSGFIGTYNLPASADDAMVNWYYYLFEGLPGPLPVYIFNIEDADEIIISAGLNLFLGSASPQQMPLGYTLSPSKNKTEIPIDQFQLLNTQAMGIGGEGSNVGQIFTSYERIPCAGNQYLHMFGCYDANDFFQSFGSAPVWLTIGLIK